MRQRAPGLVEIFITILKMRKIYGHTFPTSSCLRCCLGVQFGVLPLLQRLGHGSLFVGAPSDWEISTCLRCRGDDFRVIKVSQIYCNFCISHLQNLDAADAVCAGGASAVKYLINDIYEAILPGHL